MTLRPVLSLALGLALLVGTAACGDRVVRGGPAGVDQAVESYLVASATDHGKAHPLAPGTQVVLTLSHPNRIRITAGCNTMSGTYGLDMNRLTVGSLAATEMGCEQDRMDQDQWVAGLFAHPVQFYSGDHARIVAGDVVLALTQAGDVHADKPLAGTHWVLDTLYDGDTASSVPAGQEGSLTVNGTHLSLYDGCNAGSGTVRVAGADLVITDVTMTTRPCPSNHQDVLHAYAGVFTGTATYEITEGTLRITNGDQGLGFHAVQGIR